MILRLITVSLITVICYIVGLTACESMNEPYLIGFTMGIICSVIYITINIVSGD